MIATIIPFFLLINVPDDVNLKNGPEFRFSLLSSTQLSGINGTQVHGLNSTNSLTCRPEKDNSLRCFLKSIQITKFNEDPAVNYSYSVTDDQSLFEPFQFEIKFVEGGVEKITFEKVLKNDVREKAVRTVANLMRLGMKGSSGSLIRFEKKEDNFLSGTCDSKYLSGYNYTERMMDLTSWNLDLAKPNEKLERKDLHVIRRWNVTDCDPEIEPLIWTGFVFDEVFEDNKLKIVKFSGHINVQYNKFYSSSKLIFEEDIDLNRTLTLAELSTLIFNDIRSADEKWPAMNDPVAVEFKETTSQ